VNLSESHIRKSDPILLDRLIHAKEGEVLRVAMTLNVQPLETGQTLTISTLDPAQFPSRVDYRQALIQQQQARLATELSSTIQDLQDLSLKTYGGNTSRVIIAEGTAEQIIKSLDLAGVHNASFDQSIRLEPAPPSDEMLQSAEYLTEIAINIITLTYMQSGKRPNRQLISNALEKYINNYKKNYCQLKVLGMNEAVELESIYTEVRLLRDTEISRFTSRDDMEKDYRAQHQKGWYVDQVYRNSGIDIANQERFLMVLGAPGAGKSTFLRRIGLEALKGDSQSFKHRCIPILIELKRLNTERINIEELINNEFYNCGFPDSSLFVRQALQQGKMLILLDGLDEIATKKMGEVVKAIKNFFEEVNRSIEVQFPSNKRQNRCILSCRIASYRQDFPSFKNITVADFTDNQIKQFINSWFKSRVDQETNTAERCWNDLQKVEYIKIKGLAHSPLLLTFLCLVYDKSQTFAINRSSLYQKALRILMEEWAAEKRILYDDIYSRLSTEMENILLSEIAMSGFEVNQIFFSRHELLTKIQIFLANGLTNISNRLDGEAIINAIVVQQGIMIERVKDTYSFSHLTLQEYLTAQYIIDHQDIEQLVINHIIDQRWREVFLLVAGLMRGGADELLLLMEKQSHNYIRPYLIPNESKKVCEQKNKSKLQELLQWSNQLTTYHESNYKSTAKKIAAISLACNLSRIRDVETTNLTRNLAIAIEPNLALTLDNAITATLNPSIAFDPAFSIGFGTIIDSVLNIAHSYEKIKIFRSTTYISLITQLEALKSKTPNEVQPYQQRLIFVRRVQDLWFNSLQLNPELLELSPEERTALKNYFYICDLMVKCKENALRVSQRTWSEIESKMLTVETLV
jgi:NACHT domain